MEILTLKLIFQITQQKQIKNISHADTSSFALKTNLANLKTEVDKLDIDKLDPAPTDLTKLSNAVKNDVIKKTDYNAKITEIENKIPDISGLVKKTDYNTKITEIEGKIPDISNLATKAALTYVENKIHNVSGLATKTELTVVENKIPDISNFATKPPLTNLSNIGPDVSTLI